MKTSELSSNELLEMLANACKTYYGSGGHHKAEMNKNRMVDYINELMKRKINAPTDKELLLKGIFNGIGSY